MNKAQWELLAELLEMAADTFGNRSCNDFELPNTPENREIVAEAELLCSDEPQPPCISDDGKEIYTQDYFMMAYFKRLAKIQAAAPVIAPPDAGRELAEALIEWAADKYRYAFDVEEEKNVCVFCGYPMWLKKHAPDCLHLRAVAAVAARKAGK